MPLNKSNQQNAAHIIQFQSQQQTQYKWVQAHKRQDTSFLLISYIYLNNVGYLSENWYYINCFSVPEIYQGFCYTQYIWYSISEIIPIRVCALTNDMHYYNLTSATLRKRKTDN